MVEETTRDGHLNLVLTAVFKKPVMVVWGERPATLAVALFSICSTVAAALTTVKFSSKCNPVVFGEDDPFKHNLAGVFYRLRINTAHNDYNYYNELPWPGSTPICYGHGECDGRIALDDCTACISAAINQLAEECPMSIGAQIQLADCKVRYEQYEFKE